MKLSSLEERKEVLSVVGFPLFHYSKQNISDKAKKLVTMIRHESNNFWNADGEIIMKTKVTIMMLLFIFLVSAPAFAGGWLIYHDGSYTGKIVDAETGEPIEGAAVLGIRSLKVYGIDTRLQYIDASEATTDKEGRFEVPAITGFYWWPFASLARTEFFIFKPGYDSYPPYDLMRPGITGMEQKGFLEKGHNLIRLPKLVNTEERERALLRVDYPFFSYSREKIEDKARNFVMLIEDEKKYLEMSRGKQ